MKKAIFIIALLAIGASWSVRLHRQNRNAQAELAALNRAMTEVRDLGLAASNQLAQIEIEQAELRMTAGSTGRPRSSAVGTAASNSGPPADGRPAWPETNGFCWIDKSALPTLGLPAFRSSDSPDRAMSPEVMRLLNRVGRSFAERHPEFGRLGELTPEEASRLTSEYKQSLAEAAGNLPESERSSVAAMLAAVDQIPTPGHMDQPPAEYELHEDVATLLGVTDDERKTVNDFTREMVHRYHALEQDHVSIDGGPGPDSSARSPTSYTFTVTAFPGEGRQLKEEWVAQLTAAVGPERTKYLLAMADGWIRSDLGSFGDAERTVTFQERPGRYGIEDRSSSGYANNSGTSGPASVPPGWRHLVARPAHGGPPALRNF